jgi:pilus assembly protein CpaB
MTRQRSLVILLLALASASVAGFAAIRYTAQRPGDGTDTSQGGTTQVVIAAKDLPVGHLVTEADMQVIRWPSGTLPVGYVDQPGSIIGRGLISAMRMNEPFLASGLAAPGSGAGLPIVIPEGMRAVSVRVDDVIAVAGFVLAQTRVDVMLTMKPTPESQQTYTQVILQNMTVLAHGQIAQKDDRGQPVIVSVVTLLVTPEQGEKLVLAAKQGQIQLALRNMIDVDEIDTPGIPDTRLMEVGRAPVRVASGGAPAPRPRAATPDSTVIETYKGGVKALKRF